MNKKSLLSLCLFGASTVLSFVTLHVMSLFTISKWVGVSVGISLLVIMLVVALMFKKHKAALFAALTINAVADGLAASSLFIDMGVFPLVWQSAAVFAVMLGAFALYLLLTYVPFVRQHFIISIVLYVLIVFSIGLTCLLVVTEGHATFALALLHMIVFVAFLISLPIEAYELTEHLKHVTYCSFAGLAVAILVVLVVISDGSLDITPDFGGGGSGKDKKRNPYKLSKWV